jgi:orotidine-5'-phosphate decarboxylase
MTGLIAALDTTDLGQAQRWADAVTPACGMFKLGLEFFLANGPEGVRAMGGRAPSGARGPIFLDLKLHDIPKTVAGAVRAVLPLAPRFLSLHASGGEPMIAAAREAAEAAVDRPLLLAVTVLTSLQAEPGEVLRLARTAAAAGADGVVCSGHEVAMLRRELGPTPVLVVPGIRPAGTAAGDQRRTMTPREAAAAGADWLVVGRPIMEARDPAAAAAAIAAEIAG